MDKSVIFKSGLDFIAEKSWYNLVNIHGYPVLGVVWNLALLLVPYFSVVLLEKIHFRDGFKSRLSRISAFFVFLVWIAFIPNAAYIITDVRHLADTCATDSFYKVCSGTAWLIPVFFLYAVFGWLAFYYLSEQMRKFLEKIMGRRNSFLIIFISIPAVSLGVMLGLLNRLNSWEIITRPSIVLKTSLLYASDGMFFIDWLSFSSLLFILYILGGKIFKDT